MSLCKRAVKPIFYFFHMSLSLNPTLKIILSFVATQNVYSSRLNLLDFKFVRNSDHKDYSFSTEYHLDGGGYPEDIRASDSYSAFKFRLKRFLLEVQMGELRPTMGASFEVAASLSFCM